MLIQLVEDINVFVGLSVTEILFLLIIILVITLLLDTFFLKLALEFVRNAENTDWKEVFYTAFISIVFFWLPAIAILAIYSRHNIKIGGAIGVWILTLLLPLILTIVLIYLITILM